MSYTALYRKFRPASFEDVKGQDHIVTTLKNQIKAERIGHAYLFCGTGTGKTHTSIGLGINACEQGYHVLYTTIPHLVIELNESNNHHHYIEPYV